VWLILGMPCQHCTATLAKNVADFSEGQAKTKVVSSQHSKHGKAELFHFLHIGPMSDVTMLRRTKLNHFISSIPYGSNE
jgi:hypothetical protein